MDVKLVLAFILFSLVGMISLWAILKSCPRKENEVEEEELPPEASAPVPRDVEDVVVTVNNEFQAEENEPMEYEFSELPPAYEDLFYKCEQE